jgi:hypothetical protein
MVADVGENATSSCGDRPLSDEGAGGGLGEALGEGVGKGVGGDFFLGAGDEVFQGDLRVFGAEDDGVAGFAVFGGLELFADFGGGEGVVDAEVAGAEGLQGGEGVRALGFVGDDEGGVDGEGVLHGAGEFELGAGGFVQEEAEDDVAHGETGGGHVGFAVAHEGAEFVVATAAGDGAEAVLEVEDFEDSAGIVGEAADDGGVDADVLPESAGGEVGAEVGEGGVVGVGAVHEGADGAEGEADGFEFFGGFLGLGAFDFVDDLQEGAGLFGGDVVVGEEGVPDFAVAEADGEVFGADAEFEHGVDGEGDEFGVGAGGGVAEDVGVELDELAGAAFLGFFIAEAGADLEPLQGLFVVALAGGGEAREGGCDLGAHGEFAVGFVFEAEELAGDFVAGFFAEEVGGFEDGDVVFDEAVAAGDAAPGGEDEVAAGAGFGIEVAEAFDGLEGGHGGGRMGED